MQHIDRRDTLKGIGVGASLAIGPSATALAGTTTGDDAGTDQTGVVSSFTSVAGQGYITINGANPQDQQIEFSGADIDGDVVIEGDIYADGTWQSTTVEFPELNAAQLVEQIPELPEDVEADITITVPPIEGVYLPEAGLMTAPLTLGIDITATLFGQTLISIQAAPSADLTTGQSGSVEGQLEGTGTSAVQSTLVANDFPVPATGNGLADGELDLPSPAGSNWLQLELEMDIANPGALDGLGADVLDASPLAGSVPPRDLDGDGLCESIRGHGAPTTFDVQTLFENLDHDTVTANASSFNFSGGDPGSVTMGDVQALFESIRGR